MAPSSTVVHSLSTTDQEGTATTMNDTIERPTDGLLTREAAADLAGVGVRTIDLWVRLGKLEALKRTGGKYKVFVREADVLALVTPTTTTEQQADPFAGLDL